MTQTVSETAPNNNQRVTLGEVKRDTEHLRRGQEDSARDLASLREHFDKRFEALRESVVELAQSQAVSQAQTVAWREGHAKEHTLHEKEHDREHQDQSRRALVIDVVTAAAAGLAGIFIQPK